VAKPLADAGETLLFELSLAESKQFPRATTNDKPFRKDFPYLAEPWTQQEVLDHAAIGTEFEGGFKVPDGPDPDATAMPDFVPAVWGSIWCGLFLGILATGALATLLLRRFEARAVLIVATIVFLWVIAPILPAAPPRDDHSHDHPAEHKSGDATKTAGDVASGQAGDKSANNAKTKTDDKPMVMAPLQPFQKLNRVMFGAGAIFCFFTIAVFAGGIRRGLAVAAIPRPNSLSDEEGQTPSDLDYDGSTYQEVRDSVFSAPYPSAISTGNPDTKLPLYPVSVCTLIKGLFDLRHPSPLGAAAVRTIQTRADLRPGQDGKGVRRLVHPHGVCLAGTWRITAETKYTGYFASNKQCLVIARYSSELTLREQARNLSLVGKLFPTLVPDQKVRTGHFFTQSALGGLRVDSIFDVTFRNAPDIRPLANFTNTLKLMIFGLVFRRADSHVSERQLYEIAELGEDTTAPQWKSNYPRYMQLKIKYPVRQNARLEPDFRDEVLAQLDRLGDPAAVRKLVFSIQVSETGKRTGWINQTLKGTQWVEIGEIEFTEAAASHNGDFVIHFHHPKWRDVTEPGRDDV
jgi:hypothetical protein